MTVAAIIPAYNEETTIGEVVRLLASSRLIQEVLVISDGSTDRTAQQALEAGAKVYELATCMGKGEAMLWGVKQTDAKIIAFFDADLIGLTSDHVARLISPVLSGERIMNVGLRDRGRFITAVTKHLPLISGERVLKRGVMEGIPARFLHGYMVESALNYFCRSRGLAYGAVELTGLTIRRKYQKVGLSRAVLQYSRMAFQIAEAMVVVRVARLFGKF